jgi:hypothetical protein
MADKTKKAFVNRDFNDAGTSRQFTASTPGKPETFADIEEGAFLNYAAAGLVREPTADDKKTAAPAA